MALAEVSVTEEVWLSCITHALSTESEEIMGILFGDVVYPGHAHSEPHARKSPAPSQGPCTPEKTPTQRMAAGPWPGAPSVPGPHGQAGTDAGAGPGAGAGEERGEGAGGVAHIWCAMPQLRADRRKDRVETTPEQLMEAALYAERLGQQVGTTTRAIGWYHSHPHITVHPSHVDVRTQAMYQTLDVGFVGLIFACFDNDAASETGRVQAVAFQSIPRHEAAAHRGGAASVAAGSPMGGSFPGWQESQSQSPGGGRESSDGANDLARDDSLRLREALRLSQLETQAGDFVAREIPIRVLPSPRFLYPPFLSSPQFSTPPGGAHITFRDNPPGLGKGGQHSGRGSSHEHSAAHSTASPQTQGQTGVGMRPLGLDSFGGALDPLRALPAILFQEEQAQFHLATPEMIAPPVTTQEGQVTSLQASQRKRQPPPLAVLQNCSAYQGALCQLLDTCLLPLLQQALDQGKQARAGARGRGKGGMPPVLLEEYLSPPPPPGAGGTPSAGSTRPSGTPSGSSATPGGTPSGDAVAGGGTTPAGSAPAGGTASAGGGGDSSYSLSSLGRALEGEGFPGLEASGAPFGHNAQGRLDQVPAATAPAAASAAEGSWYAMAPGVENDPTEPSNHSISHQQPQQHQEQQQRPLPPNTRPEVDPGVGHMQGQGVSQEQGQQEFWQRQGQGSGHGQGNGEAGSSKSQWWGSDPQNGGERGVHSSRGTSGYYSDTAHAGATCSDTSTVNTGGFSQMGSTLSSSAASSSASPGSALGTPTPYSPRLQAPSFLAGADTPSAAHGPGFTAGGPTQQQGTGQVGNAHMYTAGASEYSGSGGGTRNQRAGREGPGQGLGFGSELGLGHTGGGTLYETSAHVAPMFMSGSNPFVDSGAAGPVDTLPGVYPGIPPLPHGANNNNSPAFMSSVSEFMPGRARGIPGTDEGAWEDMRGGSGPRSRQSEGNRQRTAGLGHAVGIPGADEGGPEDKKGNWLRNIKNAVKAPRVPGARASGGSAGWSGEGKRGGKGVGGL